MRRLWSEESVDHAGRDYACSGVQLCPPPESRIPLWIGGTRLARRARASRALGDRSLRPPSSHPKDTPRTSTRHGTRPALAARTRTLRPYTPAVYAIAAIGRRDGEAKHDSTRSCGASSERPSTSSSFAYLLHGTPEKWVDTIGRFGEAGAQHVLTLLVTDDMPGDVDLIVSEVLPHWHRSAGTGGRLNAQVRAMPSRVTSSVAGGFSAASTASSSACGSAGPDRDRVAQRLQAVGQVRPARRSTRPSLNSSSRSSPASCSRASG